MSERDTLDLEAGLRHLGSQVDAHSRPIGAARAVRTARRRRATRVGSAVAAALVVCLVAISWSLPHRSNTVPVTASPSLAPVEASTEPATLTSERLQAATVGWVGSWQRGAPPVSTDLPCADQMLVEPDPGGIANEYRSGRIVGATHTVTTYPGVAAATQAYLLIQASVDACPVVRSDRRYYGINEADPGPDAVNFVDVAVYSWRDGGSKGTVCLAASGSQISVLSVAGATDPPQPVAERIAEVLAADLLT